MPPSSSDTKLEQGTDTTTTNVELAKLKSATKGFDYVFSNDIASAREVFEGNDDSFHLLGLGVCAFLEAALGMESAVMEDAATSLAAAEAGAKKQLKQAKSCSTTRFPPGLEWEILIADATVLSGLVHALSESYMGYIQCLYSLNSAHSKFTKLYRTVFPSGLEGHETPLRPHNRSSISLRSAPPTPRSASGGLFSRLTGSTFNSLTGGALSEPQTPKLILPDGPVEELIVAGTAFGYGLFNLVFSVLPKKVQRMVGFLGFKYDKKLALHALAVSAAKKDVHSVFAGLVLMTYQGLVLLMGGWQANEQRLLNEYRVIVDGLLSRYPTGALWILNRAKFIRMGRDPEGAIAILQDGLKPGRVHRFKQADMLLVFELAWTLLAQRRYEEAAEKFQEMKELNSWSHATYHFIAAGCYISLGKLDKAQTLIDEIPNLIAKKVAGKAPPTEVFIKKKLEFYKEKQRRRGGDETKYVECIKISPAEEISIFWNSHSRIHPSICKTHIEEWLKLTPPVTPPPTVSQSSPPTPPPQPQRTATSTSIRSTQSAPATVAVDNTDTVDLDTPDEVAIRSLLLGVNYRTIGDFDTARHYLNDAYSRVPSIKVSTWVAGMALFEMAVLELKEEDARDNATVNSSSSHENSEVESEPEVQVRVNGEPVVQSDASVASEDTKSRVSLGPERKEAWARTLKGAEEKLDQALAAATQTTDLSSRLDSRVTILRDEVMAKREMLGIVV
ncbi:hypothetical protein AMATHDRAFT_69254 [Amanita thiersii Skay4041]|uniref:Mitochondrial outer membrane protein IML2 n=1 Tax=Amanita thiersii Skay4041 TaxID=703135 RepID=A0A2A9NEM8_9AGAR|nr:hypothetical protein AMATHDRAFT_69254 [Amanita thiersii Skay4041]